MLALAVVALSIRLIGGLDAGSALASEHNAAQLVISEVHPVADPNGDSVAANEWIELHNASFAPIRLDDWMLEDAHAISSLPDIALGAGETVIVVGSAANLAASAGAQIIILDGAHIGNGLHNIGDRVALIDPFGVRHDMVSWGNSSLGYQFAAPNAGQSIGRSASGQQLLTDTPTPWSVEAQIQLHTGQHTHDPPESTARITTVLVDPLGDQQLESVTIKNVTLQSLLTINWSLTVGASWITLPSVRLEPGESRELTGPEGKIGRGLNAVAGHLVLRDAKGQWLSTASWGADHSFHSLPSPEPGHALHFHPFSRNHPRIARQSSWWRALNSRRQLLSAWPHQQPLRPSDISSSTTRLAHIPDGPDGAQESAPLIWISEVYPNAGQGRKDAAFEWFKLSNSSASPIALDGWSIADNNNVDPLDGMVVPPGGSVVVGGSFEPGTQIEFAIADGRIGNGLANTGDQLRLLDPAGEIISAISWGNDASFSKVAAPSPEVSVQRNAPNATPRLSPPSPHDQPTAAQHPASAAPTAGAPAMITQSADGNGASQAAGPVAEPVVMPRSAPLRVTEIMPAPLSGQAEWVEIFNPTAHPVDLGGWALGDATQQTALSGVIGPRSRLIIATRALDAGLMHDTGADSIVVRRIGNGLNNDADTVRLLDPHGEIVDLVRYGHEALPAPARGHSLALAPDRWVVTVSPSPGSSAVQPLLDDSLRAPSERWAEPPDDRVPLLDASSEGGANAWMIVSFALIGVIVTLIVRRWQPDPSSPTDPRAPAAYGGPPSDDATP